MLSRILGWLGLRSRQVPQTPSSRSTRPGSATAHLFEKRPVSAKQSEPRRIKDGGDFNPYNTGKFDRSASWERISKNQR